MKSCCGATALIVAAALIALALCLALRAVAREGYGDGRNGHDRLPDDPGRHGPDDARRGAVDSRSNSFRVRHVGRNDDRHDDAVGRADDPALRARRPPCATQDKPFAATAGSLGGYFLAWTVFALAATLAQWGLERGRLLTPMMAGSNNIFGGWC